MNTNSILCTGQAVWRKVGNVGLAIQYVSEASVRVFIWHLLAMAHVPLQRHEEGLQVTSAQRPTVNIIYLLLCVHIINDM